MIGVVVQLTCPVCRPGFGQHGIPECTNKHCRGRDVQIWELEKLDDEQIKDSLAKNAAEKAKVVETGHTAKIEKLTEVEKALKGGWRVRLRRGGKQEPMHSSQFEASSVDKQRPKIVARWRRLQVQIINWC